ncbi:MAG TPA: VWA domain-containing protein [Terracidiphilus sp.]|nr:VWA domain-containing protein [Terracidiphilus sp.]
MPRILIPAVLLCLALPSWAAKRLTVAQLEHILTADTAAHKPAAEIARKIGAIELSERLTEQSLARLSQPFPSGSQPAVALLLLADRSAFLDPPPAELPSNPAPEPAAQQHLLEAAQRFAVETLPRLPNLLATRTTFSFDDSPQEVIKGSYAQRLGLHLIGTAKAEISISDERETPVSASSQHAQGGLMTWGEFGSALLIILSDSAHGTITWSHWEQTSAGLMAVFHYRVPKAASHYEIDTPLEQTELSTGSSRWMRTDVTSSMTASTSNRMLHTKPAYQGSLWIDPTTGAIFRVSLIADLNGNPSFERGAVLVDYGPVEIADKTFICPVRSLALSSAPATVDTTFAGAATQWLNENEFTNYHLFASTSRIVSDAAAMAGPRPVPGPNPFATEASQSASAVPSAVVPAPTVSAAAATSSASSAPAAATPDYAPENPQLPPPNAGSPAQLANAAPPASPEPPAPAEANAVPAASTAAPAPQPLPSPLVPLAVAPDAAPTLRVNVDRLVVPVVVRDKSGRANGNLTKADFTVFDQGKPRAITGFSILKSATAAEARASNQSQQAAAQSPAAPPTTGQNRFTVFLIDDRNLDSNDLAQVQQAALRTLDHPLAANQYDAVVSFMGVNSGITQDRDTLKAAVMKITVHRALQRSSHDCPDIDPYSAYKIIELRDDIEFQLAVAKVEACGSIPVDLPGSSYGVSIDNTNTAAQRLALQASTRALRIGEENARISLGAVESVVRAMSKLSGQRTLIVISPGFFSLSSASMSFKSQLFNQALAANVVINTLDARGLYSGATGASEGGNSVFNQLTGGSALNKLNSMQENENALAEIADGTGGTFFHDNNDLKAGLDRLSEPPEFLYLLEISLQGVKRTGDYHPLKVRLDQPGFSIEARRGYFAPSEPHGK